MVEKNTVGGVEAVGLAIIDHDPVSVELGDSVGGPGVEGGLLRLRDLLDLAEELAGGGLVEADVVLESDFPDGIEEAQGSDGVDVGCVFGDIEGDLDVALCSQVVDFVGFDFFKQSVEAGGIGEVSVMEDEPVSDFRIIVEVVDPAGVEAARAPDDSVDLVAFLEKLLGEVGAVLSRDPGDECALHGGVDGKIWARRGSHSRGGKSLGALQHGAKQ